MRIYFITFFLIAISYDEDGEGRKGATSMRAKGVLKILYEYAFISRKAQWNMTEVQYFYWVTSHNEHRMFS